MFVAAVTLSLAPIVSLLMVNLAFGVMTKAAPQMNVFSLGFPIGMIFGLFIIWVSISELLPQFQNLSSQTFIFLRDVLGR